jgi:methyl-coenzyme M reductase subunit D
MTQAANYPQCRIVPLRFLKPETSERLLNAIVRVKGIRRIMVNGPRLPATVPYGPARGSPNPHEDRKTIRVGDADVELRVQVGQVVLELETDEIIPEIKQACDEVFTTIPYTLQEGIFMKPSPTTTDYAKYGPDADPSIIGLTDPRSKDAPVFIQALK